MSTQRRWKDVHLIRTFRMHKQTWTYQTQYTTAVAAKTKRPTSTVTPILLGGTQQHLQSLPMRLRHCLVVRFCVSGRIGSPGYPAAHHCIQSWSRSLKCIDALRMFAQANITRGQKCALYSLKLVFLICRQWDQYFQCNVWMQIVVFCFKFHWEI